MKSAYRVQAAVREVEPLLKQVRLDCPELLQHFPRSIEDIAVVGGGKDFSILVVPLEGLTEAKAALHLLDEFEIEDTGLDEAGSKPHLGLLLCLGPQCFIFCDPSLGEACFRFTLAHEVGHLFNEYLPTYSRRDQVDLFDPAPGSMHLAHRDGSDSVAEGMEGTMEELRGVVDRRRRRAWSLDEVKANAFAAELLAPEQEVRRLVSGLDHQAERVSQVAARFGLSRRAAEIRVDELIAPERVGWLFGR